MSEPLREKNLPAETCDNPAGGARAAESKKGSDVGKRLATAAVLIVISLGALWLWTADNLGFAIYINFVMLLGVFEMVRNFRDRLPLGVRILLLAFAASSYVIFRFLGFENVVLGALLLFLVCFVWCVFDKAGSLQSVMTAALVIFYPTLALSVAYVLNAEPNGLFYIVFLILTACLADAAAFFVGRLLKGPKLCPAVSPNKTISGAVGGLAGGILAGLAVYFFFLHVFPDYPVYPIWQMLLGGLLGALFTEVGDLAESFVKRQIGVKDFSKLLPGHGGVMDRIDGMIFCCFFFHFYFFVIL